MRFKMSRALEKKLYSHKRVISLGRSGMTECGSAGCDPRVMPDVSLRQDRGGKGQAFELHCNQGRWFPAGAHMSACRPEGGGSCMLKSRPYAPQNVSIARHFSQACTRICTCTLCIHMTVLVPIHTNKGDHLAACCSSCSRIRRASETFNDVLASTRVCAALKMLSCSTAARAQST